MQAGANPQEFNGVGLVSFENGTYYLTTDENVKYIITCKDAHSYVGDKVVISGTITGGTGGSGGMLCVKSMNVNGPSGGPGTRTKALIAGIIIAGGIGAAIALTGHGSKKPPASL